MTGWKMRCYIVQHTRITYKLLHSTICSFHSPSTIPSNRQSICVNSTSCTHRIILYHIGDVLVYAYAQIDHLFLGMPKGGKNGIDTVPHTKCFYSSLSFDYIKTMEINRLPDKSLGSSLHLCRNRQVIKCTP